MGEKLLEVKHLHTSFFTHLGEVKAIRDVSFHVDKSEIIGALSSAASDVYKRQVYHGASGPSRKGDWRRDPV